MPHAVTPITLGTGVFSVNSYLIEVPEGFVLVDTGTRGQRWRLMARLAEDGVTAGSLKLVLITHGDVDHIGNAAYLRETLGAPIAMHAGDVGMSSNGDMFSGRNRANPLVRAVLRVFIRLPEADRFEPDVTLTESSDLGEYGLGGASILLLQGHSAGSVALLLDNGSLLCGDLLENRSSPKLGSIMDDVPRAKASVRRLASLDIQTVYPGHGRPFAMSELDEATEG